MSKRILVVEDQEDNRQILRDLLTSADFEVIEAEDGEVGLAAAAAHRPDLILMDIQLPGLDGYEATRRIKATRPCGRYPSSPSRPMDWRAMQIRRGRRVATPTFPSPTARGSCWRRSASTYPWRRRRGDRIEPLGRMSLMGQTETSERIRSMSALALNSGHPPPLQLLPSRAKSSHSSRLKLGKPAHQTWRRGFVFTLLDVCECLSLGIAHEWPPGPLAVSARAAPATAA
jgi:CheY-like chemotaxis protein